MNKTPLGVWGPSGTLNGGNETPNTQGVVMIFSTSLPRFKAFLGHCCPKASDLTCSLLLLATFLLPAARRSVAAAARSLLDDLRHAGWLLRWLGSSTAPAALLAAAQRQLHHARAAAGRLHVLTLDSTQHGQQGRHAQNTFARGNTRARPKKSSRKQKQVHRRSCHCFVFALLLTPCGLRIPYWLPFSTEEFCAHFGRPHHSQATLAAQLIDGIALPRGSRVVVVGDTAFEARQVRAACARRGWSWVVPLNPERRLAGPKPRPPVRSLYPHLTADAFRAVSFRLDQGELAALARVSPKRSQSSKHARTYWVHRRTATILNVGEVALLFSTKHDPTTPGGVQVQKVLISDAVRASTEELLGWYALRWQVEQTFKDVKEVWGAGQQQVRNVHSNEGCFNLNLWMYSLTEAWAWERGACPWDSAPRRPSHQDKRKALQREVLQGEIQEALSGRPTKQRLRQLAQRLLDLAA
jgi:hypothetical protein